MQERLRMIDGVLRFNPVPEGTEIEAEVRLDRFEVSKTVTSEIV
jgi:hypothetical protein